VSAVYLCDLAHEADRAGFLAVPLDVPGRAYASLERAKGSGAGDAPGGGLAWAEVAPGRWEAPHPRLAGFRWVILRLEVVE
jgi:hypothetical protein